MWQDKILKWRICRRAPWRGICLRKTRDKQNFTLKNRDWQNALEAFQTVAQVNPNYEDVQKQIADTKSQLDRSLQEETIGKFYAEGVDEYRKGNWVQAIVSFEKVKDLDPNYKDVSRRLRDAQGRLNREDESQTMHRYYTMGVDAMKENDWNLAISSFERVIKYDSNYRNVQSLLQEANLGLESEQENDKLSRYYENGLAEFNKGDWLQAIIAFEKVKELDPQFRDVNEKLAAAKENIASMSSKSANNASLQDSESGSAKSQNWFTWGAIFTAIFVPLLGTMMFSPTTRAKLYLLQGKYDRASRIYEQLLYKRPERHKFYITLANIYLIGNRTDETALRVYETVLQMNISPLLKQRLSTAVQYNFLKQGQGDNDAQQISYLEDELRRELKNLGN